jgi:hypothetical protein
VIGPAELAVVPIVLLAVAGCPRDEAMPLGSAAAFFISAAFFALAALVATAPLAGMAFFKTFFLALQGITISSPATWQTISKTKQETLTSPSEALSRQDQPAPRHQAWP